MKFYTVCVPLTRERSLPVRGAWVEIREAHPMTEADGSRSPCGERGLKYIHETNKNTD